MDRTTSMPTNLRRPRLLISAARHGLQDYRRDRDLRRLLPDRAQSPNQAPGDALPRLIAAEAEIEETRRSGSAGYDLARHIELLIAMLAEARIVHP